MMRKIRKLSCETCCKRLNIDTKLMKEKMILGQISSAKDELIDPDEMELRAEGDFNRKQNRAGVPGIPESVKTEQCAGF